MQGKPLELNCEVSGTPKPTATWFKNDKEISSNDEFIKISSNENVHSLKIMSSLAERDGGLYRVAFNNEFGTSETKSNVTVLSNYK